MLKPLTASQKQTIDDLLRSMSMEEKIGQTFCPMAIHWSETENDAIIKKVETWIKKYHIGAFFISHGSSGFCKKLEKAAQQVSRIPVIVNGDLEAGAGGTIPQCLKFPQAMAFAAANRPDLTRILGRANAHEGRANGIHWTLAPVCDLNLNINNPMMHTRSYGADPDHVAKMSNAFIAAAQEKGWIACTAKHFPGDGAEEREPHVCTAVNNLSRAQWMRTYGKIWKSVINNGVMSIMTGHIALPFIEKGKTWMGHPPATLSKKIQLDFLRGELGFEGCIISDAIVMLGFAPWVKTPDRAWRNVEAGTDSVLFADPQTQFEPFLQALRSKKITRERIEFAARKVLELKARVGLFDKLVVNDPTPRQMAAYRKAGTSAAEGCIKIVRNHGGVIPVKLRKGDRVLVVTATRTEGVRHNARVDLPGVAEELKRHGIKADHLLNPGHEEMKKIVSRYEAIFINLNTPPSYGTTKLTAPAFNCFWEAAWIDHPKVVFTSFGDPHKLYEIPFVHNFVAAYSHDHMTQRAAVKVWLGKMPARGKSPVCLKGFYKIEV